MLCIEGLELEDRLELVKSFLGCIVGGYNLL